MATNTRETLGSQATLDQLTAHELEALVDDFAGVIGEYALYNNAGLKSVTFPGCTGIESYGLSYCTSLECVDIGGADIGSNPCVIESNAFNGNSAMDTLILRGSTTATLSAKNALNGTKIAQGNGGIYVPDSLVNSYKTASNWTYYANSIYPISEYEPA